MAADPRTVVHVDMDAFYASVEQRDDSRLRGKPVIVGGDLRRGVVLTASYEARPFGVGSAMPMARALRLCPHAIVIAPRMAHYAEVSAHIMRILERFSPVIEPLSLDEAFLDVSGEEPLLGDATAIAKAIKQAIRSETALCASVGVASSKFVAKVASDLGKPDGLVVVAAGTEAAFLAPLPVGRLFGVGKKTEPLLRSAGLATIGDVARDDGRALRRAVGARLAEHLMALAKGEDPRRVIADRDPVTVGSEETLDHDTGDRALAAARLLPHADQVARRLRHHNYLARVVVLKVKYADFTLRTRRTTLPAPTADAQVLRAAAQSLLDRIELDARRKIRLIGVAASGIVAAGAGEQLSLLDPPPRGDSLGRTLDAIADRFGAGAIGRATRLTDEDE